MFKTKQEYRAWAKATRKNLDITTISSAIIAAIQDMKEYKDAVNIAAFSPFGTETDIRPLFQDMSKNWFMPIVIDEEKMIFSLDTNKLDLIIIPALLVDKKGYRLGYGKGYYDRFLINLPKNCPKIVPIAEELIVDALPVDKYDIAVDMAVTQNFIYNF